VANRDDAPAPVPEFVFGRALGAARVGRTNPTDFQPAAAGFDEGTHVRSSTEKRAWYFKMVGYQLH
jgi:hypothetical protein